MLYLASRSPRRRELLTQIDLEFELIDVEVDERAHPGETPAALVTRLARAKAEAGLATVSHDARARVLGADTLVVIDGEALGKPVDRQDAMVMLERLSGREHVVMSGVALASARDAAVVQVERSETSVQFATLDAATVARYVATGEADDKAGAYAIQGRAGAFVTRIEGSYSGVVGLPLHILDRMLRDG